MSQPRDHRTTPLQLHEVFSWRAAVWASIVAALAYAALVIGLGWALLGTSPWTPLRMMGAIVLGPSALSPSDTFDGEIVTVALGLHIALSIVYGVFLALVMPAVSVRLGILVGALYGLALYYINFYGFNAFSPWFVDHRDWLSILSHCVFGAVLVYTYRAIVRRGPGPPVEESTQSQFQ